jgi:hypothetical protein
MIISPWAITDCGRSQLRPANNLQVEPLFLLSLWERIEVRVIGREPVLEIAAAFFFKLRHQGRVDYFLRLQRSRRRSHQASHLDAKLDAFDF